MSTALALPPTNDKLSGARAFARSLNILLKHARLYGLSHKRSSDQLDQAWLLLQSVLTGDNGFLLGVSGDKLLLDGVPLETGPSEKSFAQMLAGAGIASIHFASNISVEDFQRLVTVFAESRPSELLANLQKSMNEAGSQGVRVNEVRFVPHDGASGESGSLAGALAASTLTTLGPEVTNWLRDPKKLLQLISAAEGTHGGGDPEIEIGPAHESGAPPLKEDDVIGVIRFLAKMGKLGANNASPPDTAVLTQELHSLDGNASSVLYQTLFATVANSLDGQAEMPDLIKLAEHLAIKFAVESYQRGEIKINAVQAMLDRLNSELVTLRKVLNAHEDRMTRAGLVVESRDEIIDRQFWAALPEWGKKNILLSDDSWCIPARNVRNFTEHLIELRDGETAIAILQKYLAAVELDDADARRKSATGIAELADLYGRVDHGLLQQAILRVGRQLAREQSLEMQTMLSAAFVHLNQEAGAKRDYTAIEQSLCSLARIEKQFPNLARDMKPRVSVQTRLRDFIAEVQTSEQIPQGLVDVLKRTPGPAAEEISNQFSHCTRRHEAERYVELLRDVGDGAIDHLRQMLRTRSASEATVGIGLLARFDHELLMEELPARLSSWARQQQDWAVRQIAASGAETRGELLLALMDKLDPLILPEAIDEIGLAGNQLNAARLMDIASGATSIEISRYAQLKAIEAIGRLRGSEAESLLTDLLTRKTLLGWTNPRELRVAAMQALQSIDPDYARSIFPRCGLDDEELKIRPLEGGSADWLRQRRYARIVPTTAIKATAITNKGRSRIALERISLGGGFASRSTRGYFGGDVLLEMQVGMRSVKSHVLIREAQAGMMFEIADIAMEDRGRLRKLISAQMA